MDVIKGPLVQEIRMRYGPHHSQIFRLYNLTVSDSNWQHDSLEVENHVGPLRPNHELALRFHTTDPKETYCNLRTDANGLFLVDRTRPADRRNLAGK